MASEVRVRLGKRLFRNACDAIEMYLWRDKGTVNKVAVKHKHDNIKRNNVTHLNQRGQGLPHFKSRI